MANLLVLTGTQQGSLLPLKGDRIVLGRDGRCGIVITDSMIPPDTPARQADSISRKHAVVSCVGGKYYIEDGDGQGKKSRNDTYVNERQVPFPERRLLENNDRIRICDFICLFQDAVENPSSVEAAIRHDTSSHLLQAQTADKLKIILEISNSLSNTLDIDALLVRIVDQLFQLFEQAHRGFIILRDEGSGQLIARVFKTRRDNEPPDARFSASIVLRCLDKVEAILGNDLIEQFPNSQSVAGLPVRSLMCAPLWSQDGQALGAIQLDTQNANHKFTQPDLNLLLGVASQASIALSNAQFHRESLIHQGRVRDLRIAQEVQRALLPQQLPDIPGYDFYAYYDPALEVGGDYYDFIPLSGGRLAILLGDVAGKGVAAALVMVKFSVEARVCLLTEPGLAEATTKLNAIMNRAALADRFVTLAAVVLDPATHTATLVNAGHPSPLLSRHEKGLVEDASPTHLSGPPLGLFDRDNWGCCQIQLAPKDRLLLFSDGVTEAEDARGRQFKAARVRAVLESGPLAPRATGERLVEAVKRHSAGCGQNDDITVVCFGRSESGATIDSIPARRLH